MIAPIALLAELYAYGMDVEIHNGLLHFIGTIPDDLSRDVSRNIDSLTSLLTARESENS